MRSSAFGHTTWKSGLGGLPAPEHKLKLSENDISISTFGDPVFDNLPAGEIEHLMQRIIVGEAWLVLGDLAELAVESSNEIGHAIDFLEKERIFFPFLIFCGILMIN